jgi:hypothetical protein
MLEKRAPETKAGEPKQKKANIGEQEAARMASMESTPKKGLSFLQGVIKNKTIKLQTLLDLKPKEAKKSGGNEGRAVERHGSDDRHLSEIERQQERPRSPLGEESRERSTGKKKEGDEGMRVGERFLTGGELLQIYASKRVERPELGRLYCLWRSVEYYSLQAEGEYVYFEYGQGDGAGQTERQLHVCEDGADGLILLGALRDKLEGVGFVDRPGQAVSGLSSGLVGLMEGSQAQHVIKHVKRPGELYAESLDVSNSGKKGYICDEEQGVAVEGTATRVVEKDTVPEYKLHLQTAETINEVYDKYSHSNPQFNEIEAEVDIDDADLGSYASFDLGQRRAEMVKFNNEGGPRFEQ